MPSLGLLVFVIHPLRMILTSESKMLADPGIGWHLQAGHYMLERGEILRHDLFSHTRPGASWVTFEWLFQCLAAGLERLGGLPLLSAVCALLFAALPALLYRRMRLEKVNVYLVGLFSVGAYLALLPHAHARPHLFTYLFFALLLERLTRYERQEVTGRSLFLFVPLTVLWTNLHGGFLLGPVTVGFYLAGAVFDSLADRSAWNLDRVRSYAALVAGMLAASLVNPFGWHLHEAILHCLTLDSLAFMLEFTSPNFKAVTTATVAFEVAVGLLLLAGGRRLIRLRWAEALLLVFLMVQALHAQRHLFLFVIVAIPLLARELSQLLPKGENWFARRSARVALEQERLKSSRLWIPVLCLSFVLLSQSVPSLFRTDLLDLFLSRGARDYIEAHSEDFGKVFNSIAVGGALIYYFWPEIKVFGDDRNDFYGDDFYLDEYLEVLLLEPNWKDVFAKYEVSSVVLGSKTFPLSRVLEVSPEWRLVFEDEKNRIFLRQDPAGVVDGPGESGVSPQPGRRE